MTMMTFSCHHWQNLSLPPNTHHFFFVPQPKSDIDALYNAIQQSLESIAENMTTTTKYVTFNEWRPAKANSFLLNNQGMMDLEAL